MSKRIFAGVLLGSGLLSAAALAQPSLHPRSYVDAADRPRAALHFGRYHGMLPIHRHGFVLRTSPFHARLGWQVTRFGSRERAIWTHGRWWHGRHHGRFGWWWWAGGGWYLYDTPVYPYPDYVSEYEYEEPEGAGDSWYYCRDPEGFYPYVKHCSGSWEPVPAEPNTQYNGKDYDDGDNGGYDREAGPDQGPMDEGGPPDNQGPMDEGGPPDNQGPQY